MQPLSVTDVGVAEGVVQGKSVDKNVLPDGKDGKEKKKEKRGKEEVGAKEDCWRCFFRDSRPDARW
jgi:hypothetical protein